MSPRVVWIDERNYEGRRDRMARAHMRARAERINRTSSYSSRRTDDRLGVEAGKLVVALAAAVFLLSIIASV